MVSVHSRSAGLTGASEPTYFLSDLCALGEREDALSAYHRNKSASKGTRSTKIGRMPVEELA
jgi:hypothetical protein